MLVRNHYTNYRFPSDKILRECRNMSKFHRGLKLIRAFFFFSFSVIRHEPEQHRHLAEVRQNNGFWTLAAPLPAWVSGGYLECSSGLPSLPENILQRYSNPYDSFNYRITYLGRVLGIFLYNTARTKPHKRLFIGACAHG